MLVVFPPADSSPVDFDPESHDFDPYLLDLGDVVAPIPGHVLEARVAAIPALTVADDHLALDLGRLRSMLDWNPRHTPAITSTEGFYSYDVTSPWWREVCRRLPCLLWMDWVGYANAIKVVKVGKQTIVIHCWKGWCQQFRPGLDKLFPGFSFPGGIGAEVGIYTFEKPSQDAFLRPITEAPAISPSIVVQVNRPPWQEKIRKAVHDWAQRFWDHTKSPDATKVWWPASDEVMRLVGPVKFTLTDGNSGLPLIDGYQTDSYWTCKWMQRTSYHDWRDAHTTPSGVPLNELPLPKKSEDFELRFWVAGVEYVWKNSTNTIRKVPLRSRVPIA